MALIVEDGTGLPNAESYVSVLEVDTYYSLRGYTLWDNLEEEAKEQALRRAMDYLSTVYSTMWKGVRSTDTQNLDHPRRGMPVLGKPGYFYADNVVVDGVKTAQILLAMKATQGELIEDVDAGGDVLEETVGPITIKYGSSSQEQKRYTNVDLSLRQFIYSYTGMIIRA